MIKTQKEAHEFYKKLALIPREELDRDKRDAMEDIANCELALLMGIESTPNCPSVRERISGTKIQLKAINTELERRNHLGDIPPMP